MARGRNLLPPDPRPSRAHPEHRAHRKQLEKDHAYGWVPPVILGLMGLTLAFDVTKDVEKAEERHKQKEGGEGGEGERRKRRKDGAGGRPQRHRAHDYDEDGEDDRRRAGDGDGGEGGDKRDGGLDRSDRLERGEGGPWDRDRERERERRKRSGYDGYSDIYDEGDGRYPRRGRDDGYDSDYERGRRDLYEHRGRPRMRRRSSDW